LKDARPPGIRHFISQMHFVQLGEKEINKLNVLYEFLSKEVKGRRRLPPTAGI
jgi:hypothetical protein